MKNLINNIFYIGVNDHEIDLFEGQYIVPNGMAYNSYVIMDEKIAVMDTVDINFGNEWLKNIKEVLGEKAPDYLIVQHMEPDHSACIDKFINTYPNCVVVGNAKTFDMLHNFFPNLELPNTLTVKEGEKLSLGSRELTFITAPMVHWPEVIMSYESSEKVLFSADGFGKFGALDVEEEWACEARRYYFGIVGKFGDAVQAVLKKLAGIEVKVICPLHGPVLTENLDYYIGLYDCWSSYHAETDGVFVAYASIHGGTAEVAKHLATLLKQKGAKKVSIADLSRCDMAEAIEDAFRMSRLVVAASSYDAGVFPPMYDFLHHLQIKSFQRRKVGIVENGSWAPCAARIMTDMLQKMKEIEIVEPIVTIRSRMKPANLPQLEMLAEELLR